MQSTLHTTVVSSLSYCFGIPKNSEGFKNCFSLNIFFLVKEFSIESTDIVYSITPWEISQESYKVVEGGLHEYILSRNNGPHIAQKTTVVIR